MMLQTLANAGTPCCRVARTSHRLSVCCSLRVPSTAPCKLSFNLRSSSAIARASNESKTDANTQLTNSADSSSPPTDSADNVMTDEQIQKFAELRRQQSVQKAASINILQGAVEEAQLITWPQPKKAFEDTLLVIGILLLSGFAIFGVNLVLTSASEAWYHRS